MAVTPADIAVALGRPAPESGSITEQQWQLWIDDAEMLIESRRQQVDPDLVLDEAKLDYVVREAVVAHVKHPDDATNVTVSVDDASTSRTYRSGKGRVQILDEWWALLGLVPTSSGAFSFRPYAECSPHLPWCSLNFGATYCSCGADIAGRPIYENAPGL